jgi:uncharacterized cupredoxin-like copper-binding protein
VAVLSAAATTAWAHSKGSKNAVQIVEKEMSIVMSRTTVHAGKVQLRVRNRGSIDHELVLLRGPGLPKLSSYRASETRKVAEVPDLAPGKTGTLTVTLAPGTYWLICNISGHYQLGMHTTLKVIP